MAVNGSISLKLAASKSGSATIVNSTGAANTYQIALLMRSA
jgi:hypothetical protein